MHETAVSRKFFADLSTYGNNRPKITAVGKDFNGLPKIRTGIVRQQVYERKCKL